jgi:hypothetical protein
MTEEHVASAFLCSHVVPLLHRSEIDTQPGPLCCSRFKCRHEFRIGIAKGGDSVEAAIEGN